jgi:predicted secreted protein
MSGRATLLALLLAAAAAAGCSSWSSGPKETPAELIVAPGERFTVALDANHSTGFRWELGKPIDGSVLTLVDAQYEEEASAAPGTGGKEVWTFDAAAPGWARIQFIYRRPWEEMAPARIAVYSVDVR